MKQRIFGAPHGTSAGDMVRLHDGSSYWSRLRKVLTHPRISVASNVDATSFEVDERRVTWTEWRSMLWAALIAQS
jgi:hypothetical protein